MQVFIVECEGEYVQYNKDNEIERGKGIKRGIYLLLFKDDGTFEIHSESGSALLYKQNKRYQINNAEYSIIMNALYALKEGASSEPVTLNASGFYRGRNELTIVIYKVFNKNEKISSNTTYEWGSEKQLKQYVIAHLNEIIHEHYSFFDNVEFIGDEISYDKGHHRIDLIAQSNGRYLIIELKARTAVHKDVDQIKDYRDGVKALTSQLIKKNQNSITMQKGIRRKEDIELNVHGLRDAHYFLLANTIPDETKQFANEHEMNIISVGTTWAQSLKNNEPMLAH